MIYDQSRTVLHVMRTYGAGGGEKQLAQMFAQGGGGVVDQFTFLYRDALCEALFAEWCSIKTHRLWPWAINARNSPWIELLILLPLLPFLQVRFLVCLLRARSAACVVHGFQSALVAWPAAMLVRRVGFGYIHRITKSATGRNSLFRIIYAPYRRLGAVSCAATDSLRGLVPDSKLMPMENGINVERIRLTAFSSSDTKRGNVFISVGRLLPRKGHELTVGAFAKCFAKYPDAELWIVGEGEARRDIEKEIEALGLRGRVRLLGYCKEVPLLLAQASVFVHAADREGLSNAVLEAMAVGLPSVVVDAPGVSECHVDGITGFVVPGRVDEIAHRMATLLGDSDLRNRMGTAALRHVEAKYSMKANRDKYLALYEQLMDN